MSLLLAFDNSETSPYFYAGSIKFLTSSVWAEGNGRPGKDWTGLDWLGLAWTGLDWLGLNFTGVNLKKYHSD